MRKIFDFRILILISIVRNVTCDEDEATIEIEAVNSVHGINGPSIFDAIQKLTTNYEDDRNGKVLWSYPQSPIIDLVMQSAAPNYVPKNGDDFFDFLRDSYPLPGGK